MSEAASAPAPDAATSTGPGPTSGTPTRETASGNLAPEATPPAPLSSEEPSSILSDAVGTPETIAELTGQETPKTEEPKADEPKEEAKAEETKAEAPEEPKDEPLAPPAYEAFTLPEGVTLEDEKVGAFTGLLGEYENKVVSDPKEAHAAFQELGQKMVDLYLNEVRETTERAARLQRDVWDRTQEEWTQKFRDDPEIGKNRQQTTLQRAGALISLYGQQTSSEAEKSLREVMGFTGAGNNPEVIRFINWAASRLTETARPIAPAPPKMPSRANLSPAQRLYKTSSGAA